jgi:predicted AAA+ superfamily ATPase
MKRKIYEELLAWKTSDTEKALMIMGARQIGKTYIIDEFCRAEYKNYIHFNLFDRADIVSIFKEDINTSAKIEKVELLIGQKLDQDDTVIFFDEVQESEDVIASLKYFVESPVNYHIICAGSLLGVKIRRFSKAFPVGKVKMLQMYPLDFEEYMEANDEEPLVDEIKRCFSKNIPMVEALHEKCLKYFHTFLCSGGMPEVVAHMIEVKGDVLLFDSTKLADIRNAYISDMGKYILTPLEKTRIEAIYNSIPLQLGNTSGKFQYAKAKKGARGRDYESALDWLVSSNMVYKCNIVTTALMPLKGYENDAFFKLFLNDTGLLVNLLGIRLADIMLDTDFNYKGVITENYVASQFVAKGLPLYFWKSNNTAEVDFLLDTPEGIVPVEVKSGKTTVSPSIRVYSEKFHPNYVIKISAKNFGFTGEVKSIPLYAVFCIST